MKIAFTGDEWKEQLRSQLGDPGSSARCRYCGEDLISFDPHTSCYARAIRERTHARLSGAEGASAGCKRPFPPVDSRTDLEVEHSYLIKDPVVDPAVRAYYGGPSNPFEAIKVIEAWGLGFNLGTVAKYLCRAGKRPDSTRLEDLQKARWYLDREIKNESGDPAR